MLYIISLNNTRISLGCVMKKLGWWRTGGWLEVNCPFTVLLFFSFVQSLKKNRQRQIDKIYYSNQGFPHIVNKTTTTRYTKTQLFH